MTGTLFLATATLSFAQVTVIEPEPLTPARDAADLGNRQFLQLTGEGCAVGFRAGALDRAHHLLRRLEVVTYYFNRWSDVPVPIAAYLLDREGWKDYELTGVYGIPLRPGPVAVMAPAEGDDEAVLWWREALGTSQVPMVPGVPLKGTPEGAGALAIADVLMQVEAARGFVQRVGLLGRSAWAGEVAAHLAALVIFGEHEPGRLPDIGSFYARLYESQGGGSANALSAYSPLLSQGDAEEMRTWLWFQGAFYEGARRIYAKSGKKSVKALLKLSRESGGVLSEEKLVEKYPELSGWLQGAFGAETG